jgi:hypothetical protein
MLTETPALNAMPEKIDVFFGPAESGKTRRAHELYDGKNAAWFDGRNKRLFKNPSPFANVTDETEVIIIDDLPLTMLQEAIFTLSVHELVINAKMKKPFSIPRPKIVITVEHDDKALIAGHSLLRRANFIRFPLKPTADMITDDTQGTYNEVPKEEPEFPFIDLELLKETLRTEYVRTSQVTEFRNLSMEEKNSFYRDLGLFTSVADKYNNALLKKGGQ